MARKGTFKSLEHELSRRSGAQKPKQTAQAIGRAKQVEQPAAPVQKPTAAFEIGQPGPVSIEQRAFPGRRRNPKP